MEIFINGRFLSQRITGVQRFAFEVVQMLVKEHPDVKILVPKNAQLPVELREFCVIVGQLSGTLWEQMDLPFFLAKRKVLLLNLCNTAPLLFKQNIITIHDCAVFEHPSWFSASFRRWYKFLVPKISRKALHIFTVSEFSKREITKWLKVLPDKITVVYPGISSEFGSGVNPDQKEPVFLHVGTLSDRKNVQMLIEGFKASNHGNYRLVLCGKTDKNLTFSTADLNDPNIIVEENCTDARLHEWLKKAQFIVSASHYEGFGIPVLEGIYNGARPLLSDIPVYWEWVGKYGIYFKKNDQNDLKTKIEYCINTKNFLTLQEINYFSQIFNYYYNITTLWNPIIQIMDQK